MAQNADASVHTTAFAGFKLPGKAPRNITLFVALLMDKATQYVCCFCEQRAVGKVLVCPGALVPCRPRWAGDLPAAVLLSTSAVSAAELLLVFVLGGP